VRAEPAILDLVHQLLLIPALVVIGVLAATAAAWVALLTDRSEPARIGRREIGTLSREAAARIVLGAAGLVAWGDGGKERDPRGRDSADPTPVLLVPGAPQRPVALLFLRTFLRSRGYRILRTTGPGRGGLAQRAEHIGAHVRALADATGSDRVDIVAHGLGGLAAAWYVRHLGGSARVRRLVTLGTPWRGTRMAVFTRGHLGRETLPGAPVLDDLSPCGVPTFCIWGSLDPMVLPQRSAIADDAVSIEIDGAGHLDLLLSARAFRATDEALRRPEPSEDP